jgi:hypothetical protein
MSFENAAHPRERILDVAQPSTNLEAYLPSIWARLQIDSGARETHGFPKARKRFVVIQRPGRQPELCFDVRDRKHRVRTAVPPYLVDDCGGPRGERIQRKALPRVRCGPAIAPRSHVLPC